MTKQELIAGALAHRANNDTKLWVMGNAEEGPIRAQELVDWLIANPTSTRLEIVGGKFDDAGPLIAYFKQSPRLTHVAIREDVVLPDLPGEKKAIAEIAQAIALSNNPHVLEVCLAGEPAKRSLEALCDANRRSASSQIGEGTHVDSLMARIASCGGLPPMA